MVRAALLTASSALSILLALPALAGDQSAVGSKATRPGGSWTGFYLGTYAGAGLVDSLWGPGTNMLSGGANQPFPFSGPSAGALIGGQLGYNYQIGSFVIGAEGDLGTGTLYGTARCGHNWYSVCNSDTDLLATLTGRVAYAFDNVLLYGKAGAAFINSSYSASGSDYAGQLSGAAFRTGWTVGAGVEAPLTPQMSVKAEYAYLDFGTSNLTLQNGLHTSVVAVSTSAQMVKLGLNWRPGGPPLPGSGSPLPTPGRDWSGFYLGVHAGGAWGRDDWSSPTGFLADASKYGSFPGGANPMGLLGGGQMGFNLQSGPWVVGIEASASAADIDAYAKCDAGNSKALDDPTGRTCHDSVAALGSIAGRVGQSWGDLLVYGKAGGAFVNSSGDVFDMERLARYAQSGTRWGWMLGSGVEYAISQNISAFMEYDYYDFGTQSLTYSGWGKSAGASFRQRLDAVRMGLNYRFTAGGAESAGPAKVPGLPMGWTAEIGARYFASTGRMQKDLYGGSPSELKSRLIYANTTGQSAETFFRFENKDGLFLKGFAGLGGLSGGGLNDEDFPPSSGPYSNTYSELKDGSLAYGALDMGYDFLRQGGTTLGAFVGYRGFFQEVNGFGCHQLTSTGEVCDREAIAHAPGDGVNLGLSETESWQGVALGLNARLRLSDRLRLEVDAAYLPYVTKASADNHWAKPENNPEEERGNGWGTQLEAVLSYEVNDRLSVGLGARYWYFKTDTASTVFPGGLRQAMTFYSERYGAFAQASYLFGDLPPKADGSNHYKTPDAPANWSGLYVGGTLGGGKGHSTYVSPFATPVSGDAVDLGGAMAGGQIGADWQIGALVVGAEASAAWANVVGTNTCFSTAPEGRYAGFNCGSDVNALGTVTARLGYAVDKVLLYARGGFAWDQQTDLFNTYRFTKNVNTHDSINTGWTGGFGLEYALMPDLSVGLEYKHFDFGASSSFFTSAPSSVVGVNLAPDGLRLDMVAMTLNYRFASLAMQ